MDNGSPPSARQRPQRYQTKGEAVNTGVLAADIVEANPRRVVKLRISPLVAGHNDQHDDHHAGR